MVWPNAPRALRVVQGKRPTTMQSGQSRQRPETLEPRPGRADGPIRSRESAEAKGAYGCARGRGARAGQARGLTAWRGRDRDCHGQQDADRERRDAHMNGERKQVPPNELAFSGSRRLSAATPG